MMLLGIDVGGTKTSVCVGTGTGKIIATERMPTRPERGPDRCTADIIELSKRTIREAGVPDSEISVCGIAAPGPIDSGKGLILSPPNMAGWDRVPFRQMISEGLQCKAAMNNDANAAVLAEYHFGEFKGTANMVYLTHSTGMGGGIITNGQLVQGRTDTAGEVGHFVLNPEGPVCPCGLRGCFEVYCGGKSTALRLQDTISRNDIKTSIRDKVDGNLDNLDFKVFLEAAMEGDNFAVREWRQYVEHLAHGLGIIIMTLNPDVIVMGTIAVNSGDFLMDPLKKRLPEYVWERPLNACVVKASAIGSKVGNLGALAVAIDENSS